MDLAILVKGLVIGFSIAAPVGPIGVLCIRRTLAEGRRVGLISGLGAASADAIYGSLAAFGVTWLSSFLVDQASLLGILGGVFLCYLGIRTFLATTDLSLSTINGGMGGVYASTFFLTLTNPATIISFAAVFSGLGLANEAANYGAALLMVVGVFLGSSAWWFLLSGIVSYFQGSFGLRGLSWINKISGIMILAFGVLALMGNLL
jgi:threonine/homoserine/homoserine lactone efflux protein